MISAFLNSNSLIQPKEGRVQPIKLMPGSMLATDGQTIESETFFAAFTKAEEDGMALLKDVAEPVASTEVETETEAEVLSDPEAQDEYETDALSTNTIDAGQALEQQHQTGAERSLASIQEVGEDRDSPPLGEPAPAYTAFESERQTTVAFDDVSQTRRDSPSRAISPQTPVQEDGLIDDLNTEEGNGEQASVNPSEPSSFDEPPRRLEVLREAPTAASLHHVVDPPLRATTGARLRTLAGSYQPPGVVSVNETKTSHGLSEPQGINALQAGASSGAQGVPLTSAPQKTDGQPVADVSNHPLRPASDVLAVPQQAVQIRETPSGDTTQGLQNRPLQTSRPEAVTKPSEPRLAIFGQPDHRAEAGQITRPKEHALAQENTARSIPPSVDVSFTGKDLKGAVDAFASAPSMGPLSASVSDMNPNGFTDHAEERMADLPARIPVAAVETSGLSKSVSMTAPDLPRHVSQQIVLGIRSGASNTVDILLNPAELGSVRISLSQAETGWLVSVHADRQDTLDLLRRHIDLLGQDLRDIGYGGAEFTFGEGPGHSVRTPDQTIEQTIEGPADDAIVVMQNPTEIHRSIPVTGRIDLRM